jgi:hypothetical protein
MKRVVVYLALLAVLAAGCSSGGADSHAGASPSSSGANQQRAMELGSRFVQCARQHGLPNFPDPVWRNGEVHFGNDHLDKTKIRQLPEDCQSILDQLPATGQRHQPYTAEEVRRLAQFAQCLRQHGIPEWPDPDADGKFPLSGTPLQSELESEGESQRMSQAQDACSQYWDKGLDAS